MANDLYFHHVKFEREGVVVPIGIRGWRSCGGSINSIKEGTVFDAQGGRIGLWDAYFMGY